MKYVIILNLILFITLWGCAREVTLNDFEQIIQEGNNYSYNSVFYSGSDRDYHYLVHATSFSSKTYRVPKDQIVFKREFKKTNQKSQWIRIPKGIYFENMPRLEKDFIVFEKLEDINGKGGINPP